MGGAAVNFSMPDYKLGLAVGDYVPPAAYRPFMRVNRSQFRELEKDHGKNGNDVAEAFRELRRRVSDSHWRQTYSLQALALSYSEMSFPAYRFILPEVVADDWLATVDWHKFHRDHVLHQPLTAYVVQKLLKERGDPVDLFLLSDGRNLLDACVDEVLKWDRTAYLKEFLLSTGVKEPIWFEGCQVGRTLWKSLFLEAAFLAAMFHDMGYPWQYVNLLSNKLEHAECRPDSPTPDAGKVVSTFGTRLLYYPFNGYRTIDRNAPMTWPKQLAEITDRALRRTHGFPGAIGFLYLNDVLRDYPTDNTHPIRQFCVEWAAMAIMMHDMAKIYWGDDSSKLPDHNHMRLRFEVDPLSSVIALADCLQDFSRPSAVFQNNANSVELSYADGCDSTNLDLSRISSDGAIKIVYEFADTRQLAAKLKGMHQEQRIYFDRSHGYIDFSALGISRVDMDAQMER